MCGILDWLPLDSDDKSLYYLKSDSVREVDFTQKDLKSENNALAPRSGNLSTPLRIKASVNHGQPQSDTLLKYVTFCHA